MSPTRSFSAMLINNPSTGLPTHHFDLLIEAGGKS